MKLSHITIQLIIVIALLFLIWIGDPKAITPGIRISKLAHDDITMSILLLTYLALFFSLGISFYEKKPHSQKTKASFWLSVLTGYLGISCFLNSEGVTFNGLPIQWLVFPASVMLIFSMFNYIFGPIRLRDIS
ncbi:MAG: hypothetical protein ACYSTT_18945 [Planctomycetota bacterium]|jgi:hypothetical protein